MINKKAQLELTFNWIYVLIAGAVILLFFVGIVVKQKDVAETNLTNDLVKIMDSILNAVSNADNTRTGIDTSGLARYTLFFDCHDIISEMSVGISSSRKSFDSVQPIFSPQEIKTSRLIAWSMPYKLPYKIVNFLMITSYNTKYYLYGSDSFINEFMKSTEGNELHQINAEELETEDSYNSITSGKNFQVRVVDFSGTLKEKTIPYGLKNLADDKVTLVSFIATNKIQYFQKSSDGWVSLGQPISIISISQNHDAAKYAAIFAANAELYQCNMLKAIERLQYHNEIYVGEDYSLDQSAGKLKNLIDYYELNFPEEDNRFGNCLGNLKNFNENLFISLISHKSKTENCLIEQNLNSNSCLDLMNSAQKISNLNKNLNDNDCLTLY